MLLGQRRQVMLQLHLSNETLSKFDGLFFSYLIILCGNNAAILPRPLCVYVDVFTYWEVSTDPWVISMAWPKTAVSPLITQWRYCSLALNLRYNRSPTHLHDPNTSWGQTIQVGVKSNQVLKSLLISKFAICATIGEQSDVPVLKCPYYRLPDCKNKASFR